MAGLWALELEEADTRRNWEGLDLGITLRDFPGGSDGKASACNLGDWVQSLSRENPLEKEVATHSSTLAWKIP